jgi:ribokinase
VLVDHRFPDLREWPLGAERVAGLYQGAADNAGHGSSKSQSPKNKTEDQNYSRNSLTQRRYWGLLIRVKRLTLSSVLNRLGVPQASKTTMAKRPRIAVVGSANIDLTTFTERFPKPGETIFGQKFDLGFGGKGANQAVAARLCGAEVFMVARVGSDLFGPATIENFRKQGIDPTHVRQVDGLSSGVAPIFVEPNGQNRIFVVKGANDALKPSDVDAAAEVLKSSDCIVLQFEIPIETVYYTIAFAHKHGIRCILNPAPAQPVDMAALKDLDYFVPNESEAEAIMGVTVKTVDDAKQCAEKLLAGGIRRAIITLGANGSLLATREGWQHVPPFAVNSVDSTGAGDAFIGSFAVFLGEGVPEKEAVRRANLYAALSTTGVGTQKSFYERARFDAEWTARS